MITYEVTATVRADLADRFAQFMRDEHIPDLLATGAFVGASLGRSGETRFRIRYEARSRQALDAYLRDHAPRLRAHVLERFPAGIELSREEWDVVATWPQRG